MSILFQEDARIYNVSIRHRSHETRSSDIPKSDELSGIELRLSRVLIKRNGVPKIFPFPGLAQMYLLVIVISDIQNLSIKLELKGFHKVDDMEDLPIDRTIFYWRKDKPEDKNPGQIHAFVSVIKSNEKIRDVGQIISQVEQSEEYKDLKGQLQDILSGTQLGQVTDTLFRVASVIGKYLERVDDKPLLTWIQSFTDINGDLDFLGKRSLEQKNDRAALAMTLIVRDKAREEQALNSLKENDKEKLKIDTH